MRLKYNPSHMPEDELLRSFVVRQRDLAAILEVVRENTGASNQHLLILGPRGMGKTTLINRAVAEIHRDPELGERWYPIVYDEESYTVTSAGELWFQALSHLADHTQDSELARARDSLRPLTDRVRLRDAAMARLLEFADARRKRLLLVFENVDMIFDAQMSDDDGWDVRHTLQNEPRIMVLATSPARLATFHDSRRPLYEQFVEYTLDRLDLEQCRIVWQHIAGSELPRHQARPIQIFTGGNTRILTILATIAGRRSFRELIDGLVGLVDEHTSYFKHHIEALPPESRKIFVTLADLWSPSTSREVATRTRGDIRAVSAQLGRLVEQGIVEVVRRVDRTQTFQISERMSNLYYLLRRRGSDRVRLFIEFIACYYENERTPGEMAKIAGARAPDADASAADEILWTAVVADARVAARQIPHIIALSSLAAAQGRAATALHVLATSPSAPRFEPLLVALARLAGQPTNPPHEVSEVADDILRDIERLRETLGSTTTVTPTKTEHHPLRQQPKRSHRRAPTS